MKLILFSFLLLIPNLIYSQKGFKVIRKAENKIKHGHYSKALKLLNKADTMDYGFCGNAWSEADEAIALNRIKIYRTQGGSLIAANELNKLNVMFSPNIDSLKVEYFALVFEKSRMKREIDSCIDLIPSIDSIDFMTGLKLGVKFSETPFIISYDSLLKIRVDMDQTYEANKDKGMLERFKISLYRQPFYRLLE